MTLRDIEFIKRCDVTALDQEHIWFMLIGEPIDPYNVYRNPTRSDKNPGCKFLIKEGNILLKDFSTGQTMNCVQAYSKVYGTVGYKDTYKLLYEKSIRFRLESPNTQYKAKKQFKDTSDNTSNIRIFIEEKPFNAYDVKYWEQFGLTLSDLRGKDFHVARVDNFKMLYLDTGASKTTFLGTSEESDTDTCYAYVYDSEQYEGFIKLYFPFKAKGLARFKSNLNEIMLFEEVRNKKEWIITKSHKDFLLIRKIVLELDLDISVTHVQSEGSIPKKEEWHNNHFITLFDNDEAGILGANKFKEHYPNSTLEFIPKSMGKDISEMVANGSYQDAKDFIKSIYSSFKFNLLW